MRTAAIALACALIGCSAHPFAAAATINTAVVVGAGVCSLDCSGSEQRASEAVLIGELALSSLAIAVAIGFIVDVSSGGKP